VNGANSVAHAEDARVFPSKYDGQQVMGASTSRAVLAQLQGREIADFASFGSVDGSRRGESAILAFAVVNIQFSAAMRHAAMTQKRKARRLFSADRS
jgi:hypothetical protein